MVRERHLSTISSTHKVDTTSRCADLSARISPPQRQLLRQLAQIDAKCKSATPKTRTIHSISCLLMKAVLILNHSQHTLYWQAQRPQSYLHHEVGATQEELAKMEKYKAWEVVPRLSNMRVMVARWVYCETGKPSACKARSVPKGFSQIEGSTLMSSLHSTIFNLECDIKAAFLNNDLESTIYLAPPEGSHFPRKAINSLFQHSI